MSYIADSMLMKRIHITFFTLFILMAGYGNIIVPPEGMLFETVRANGVNINSRVYAVIQDHFGFMWFGTDYGLLRYDGYRTARVQSSDVENTYLLGTSAVESLAIGGDSTLWIGSSEGLINIDLMSWQIERPDLFVNHRVRSLLNQGDSIIWLGTAEGIFKYYPATGESIYFNMINSNLSQNMIRTFYLDSDGNLWVGSADKLNVLYEGRNRFEALDLKGAYKPNIKHNLVLDIQAFADGSDSTLLIGTETGLILFNRFSKTYWTFNQETCELTNEVVKSIYARNKEAVYFGTDLGFNKLDILSGQVEKHYHNPFNQHAIINNQIWDIQPDRSGNLWLATSNGISRLNISPEPIRYYPVYIEKGEEPVGAQVSDLIIDSDNTYWIATSNGLLTSKDRSENRKIFSNVFEETPLSIDNINAVSIDERNRIWIGSVAGINIWDPVSKKLFIPQMDDEAGSRVSSNYISTILKGHGDFFWICTWGGGLYRASSSLENMEDIKINYVADFNGQTIKGGVDLWTLDENSFLKFNVNTETVERIDGIRDQSGEISKFSICYTSGGIIWIGSRNGLLKYDISGDSFEFVKMPIDEEFIVTGILEDRNGILWGSNENTLFRFDPDQNLFQYFPIPERIPLKKFMLSPFRQAPDGDIVVCGFDGFLKFTPLDFSAIVEEPIVWITAIEVNGESLYPGKIVSGKVIIKDLVSNVTNLILSSKERNIRLEYSSFSYGHVGQQQYSCILDGFESDWRVTEPGSNATDYINLPPGKYVFKVKSMSGITSDKVNTLNIIIRMPFWASPPLLAFYIILFLVIIGFMIYQYRNHLKTKARMNLMQIEQEQDELQNASKLKFYINISNELITSISLITDPLKQVLAKEKLGDDLRRTLQLIERNANYLKVYINQLLNFRKIEIGHDGGQLKNTLEVVSFCKEIIESFKGRALSKGISLKLKSNLRGLTIETDEEKLHSIIQNLVSNAIRFTPRDGEVVLSLKVKSQHEFVVVVKDTGIGIGEADQEKVFERFYQVSDPHIPKRGMGIGLTIVRDFVEVMKGSIELKSEIGKGTRVRLTLPTSIEIFETGEEEVYVKEYVGQDTITNSRKASRDYTLYSEGLPLILVVDEINDLYDYIRSSLMKKYCVIWAPNGGEAMDFIRAGTPALIISEIQLPDMDGISFCRQVRKDVKSSRIPIILLTSKIEIENQLKAIEAGVDVFLAKPFEIEVLEANIANLLRNVEKTEAFINRRLLLQAQEVEVDSKDDKLLKEVVEYIHKNMENSQIQARDISYALGISHSNLYRRIKNITGQSLNEFIRFVRLQKAEHLLSSGKLSVSEVMYQVGFTNHSYFAKCFKKLYQVTPKNYAKN